jgi:phosphatidylglycerophosphatase C
METGAMLAGADEASAAPMRVVLFDFDGVIVRGDSFETFVRETLRGARWRVLLALPVLPFLLLLWPTFFGRNLIARSFIRAATFGWGDAGYRRRIADYGRAYARRPGVFLRDGVIALRRHVAAGDRVYVVTGCEHSLAEAILDEVKLDGIELVASRVRGSWCGLRVLSHNYGKAKVARLATLGSVAPWACVYSDSLADLPMLRGGEEAVLVNASEKVAKKASRALKERMRVVHWF